MTEDTSVDNSEQTSPSDTPQTESNTPGEERVRVDVPDPAPSPPPSGDDSAKQPKE